MTIPNISAAPEVKAPLPDVLIDWLCKLAVSDGDRKKPVQTFILTCGELSGKSVQDIRYAGEDHQYRMIFADEQGGTTK